MTAVRQNQDSQGAVIPINFSCGENSAQYDSKQSGYLARAIKMGIFRD